MKTISVYNIKGGVGKTTSTVNLAYEASIKSAERVLICDLDPQGSASFYFKVSSQGKHGKKDLLKGDENIRPFIRETDYPNLDILPADFSYRNLDLFLGSQKKPERKLKKTLSGLGNDYGFIFIDAPPNITLLSEALFEASDSLVIPLIPTILSMRTFDTLLTFLDKHDFSHNRITAFFSMVEKKKKLHAEILAGNEKRTIFFCKTVVPFSSEIERMGLYRCPIQVKKPKGEIAAIYRALWTEIAGKIR